MQITRIPICFGPTTQDKQKVRSCLIQTKSTFQLLISRATLLAESILLEELIVFFSPLLFLSLPSHARLPAHDLAALPCLLGRDENGWDMDGYHRYYICFHISVRIRIRIRIRIVSTMSDRIRLDIDIINMRFEYSDTDTVSDVGYPDSDTDRSQPL